MHRLTQKWKWLAGFALIALVAAGCNDGSKAASGETKIQQDSYSYLAAHQPAHKMTYSPTRATLNKWIDTWNVPGKLAYVYLMAANGDIVGYYVLVGPPVTACAAQTPTYAFTGTPGDGSDVKNQQVKAPSVDGVFYSGGQCTEYYGVDAATKAFVGFSIGQGQNMIYYDQPLPRQQTQNAHNLGPSGK